MCTSLCTCNHMQDSAYEQVTIAWDHNRVETYNADKWSTDVGYEIFQNSYKFGAAGSSTTSESELASTDSVVRKRDNKKQSSPIWNYFEKCKNQPNFARWIICGSKYQHSSNTSNIAKVTFRQYWYWVLYIIIELLAYSIWKQSMWKSGRSVKRWRKR